MNLINKWILPIVFDTSVSADFVKDFIDKQTLAHCDTVNEANDWTMLRHPNKQCVAFVAYSKNKNILRNLTIEEKEAIQIRLGLNLFTTPNKKEEKDGTIERDYA